MSLHPLRIAIALLAATIAGPAAWAQTSAASSPSRADVKAETRALEKAGKLEPAGPGGTREERMAPPPTSTKTRAERKAETRAAARAKQLTPAGEAPEAPKK